MKRYRYILTVFLCVTSLVAWCQDYARMGERTIMGTARYVGMGGAMTAIGGDPSAVHDNPAGLGLYRRTELMATFDVAMDRTWQAGYDDVHRRSVPMLPHASLVLSLPTYDLDGKGVQFNNFMFSFQRLHCYNRELFGGSDADISLGALLDAADIDLGIPYCIDTYNADNALLVKEYGYVQEYALDWAMNISNRWFLGAGFHVQSYSFSSDATYEENFKYSLPDGTRYGNSNVTTLLFTGAGCNFSAGLIYRPASWARLGFGIQTPTLGSLSSYTTGIFYAQTDSLCYSEAPKCSDRDNGFHMPLHTSASLAFQIGAYGMISFQYDYTGLKQQSEMHSLRAGLEVIPVMGLYINAGYGYESPFRRTNLIVPMDASFNRQDTYFQQPKWTQYASVAVGYRGTYMLFQAAYQFRVQRLQLAAHELATPYDINTNTHRIVFTIGWHHN